MNRKFFICLIILISTLTNAQTLQKGDIALFVDSLISQMPSSISTNEYKVPSQNDLTIWGNVIQELYNRDYTSAGTNAAGLDYSVVHFVDTTFSPDKDYYLLVNKSTGNNYWGTFIIDPEPDRQTLFIQSPHPLFDFNTGKQSIRIFKGVGARAYIISGAHRCNNVDSSNCSGTTTVCSGNNEKFKVSDQAHNVNSVFQKSTEVMLNNISQLVIIQVHGFSKGSGDPDLIMSNGLQSEPQNKFLDTLKVKLLNEDNSLTFKIAHVDTNWEKLNGTTNTQGRLINGSGSPCDKKPSINTGRFLHIEQAKEGLRDNSANWNKLLNAIAATFPLDPITGIESVKNEIPSGFRLFQNNPNPFNPSTQIQFIIPEDSYITLTIFDLLGKKIVELVNRELQSGSHSVYWNGKDGFNRDVASGTYIYRLYSGKYSESKKMILLR